MIHAASLARSPRLLGIYRFLRRRGKLGATSLELARINNGVAIGTDISEIRIGEKLKISCVYSHRSVTGRKVYRYTLVGRK